MTRHIPRLLVGGTGSGVGKTLLAAGLTGALRRRGLVVQPFKCGPDYIDPGWHSRAAGRPCRSLDAWMLNEVQTREAFVRGCVGADIAVIEGVMGLFDGAGYDSGQGSAAHIAALLGAPVLLVMSIAGSARSAAAVALGFARFDPDLPVAAVALNFAGSAAHARGCAGAIAAATGLAVPGWLPRDAALRVPERHLGLLTAAEAEGADAVLAAAADAVAERFDLDALLTLAARAPALPEAPPVARLPAGTRVLAVARDAAFCFYYPETLDLLEAAGARLAFFSPVAGERLPAGAGGVYLGGGYPELHAAALAANAGLWADLHGLHARGAPILAECGGFMALAGALVDVDGVRHRMAGLVPGDVRMTKRLASLGYREATALRDTLLADAGETLRGHEFRYSVWETGAAGPPAPAWRLRGARADAPESLAGHAERGLLASYLHIHPGQRPALAQRLVARLAPPC